MQDVGKRASMSACAVSRDREGLYGNSLRLWLGIAPAMKDGGGG